MKRRCADKNLRRIMEYDICEKDDVKNEDINNAATDECFAESMDINNITIAGIAKYTGEKPTTIRRIVMEMEKSGLLSTSNKEANKHRNLNIADLKKIQKVLSMHRNNNIAIINAIAELEIMERTGVETSLTDVQRETLKSIELLQNIFYHNQNMEKRFEEYAQKMIAVLDKNELTQKEAIDMLEKQEEEIKDLKELLMQQSKEIEELKQKKKRKILGLF